MDKDAELERLRSAVASLTMRVAELESERDTEGDDWHDSGCMDDYDDDDWHTSQKCW